MLLFVWGIAIICIIAAIVCFIKHAIAIGACLIIAAIILFFTGVFLPQSEKDKKVQKDLDKKIERIFSPQNPPLADTCNNVIANNSVQCKNCHNTISNEALYCPHCGEKQKEPIDQTKGITYVSHEISVKAQSTPEQGQNGIEYIKKNNMLYRADGQEISDEEIPNLIQLGWQYELEKQQKNTNPKFHRTAREEELSFQFSYNHESEIQKWESSFEEPYRKSFDAVTIEEKLVLLEEAAENFEKAKKRFFAKGKGATIYFEDTWLYMHNSKNECFSYGDMIQNSIDKLKVQY